MTAPAIIDIIAAAFLLGFTVWGARRGLFRALAGLVVVILALVGARFAAEALASPAAELAAPAIERYIEKQLDAALTEGLGELRLLPEELLPEELLGFLGIAGDRLEDLVSRAQEGARETGTSILSAVARSMAESFFYGLIYILAFLLLAALLRMAARLLDLALKLPVFHGANALGGAAVGLIEGVLMLVLLVALLRRFGISPEGSWIFDRIH